MKKMGTIQMNMERIFWATLMPEDKFFEFLYTSLKDQAEMYLEIQPD